MKKKITVHCSWYFNDIDYDLFNLFSACSKNLIGKTNFNSVWKGQHFLIFCRVIYGKVNIFAIFPFKYFVFWLFYYASFNLREGAADGSPPSHPALAAGIKKLEHILIHLIKIRWSNYSIRFINSVMVIQKD